MMHVAAKPYMTKILGICIVGCLLFCWCSSTEAPMSIKYSHGKCITIGVSVQESTICWPMGFFQRGGDAENEDPEEGSDEYDNEYDEEDEDEKEDEDDNNEVSNPEVSENESKELSNANSNPSSGIITTLFESVAVIVNSFFSFFFPSAKDPSPETQQDESMSQWSDEPTTVVKGKFQNALKLSRSKARLLLVYLPGGDKKSKAYNEQCIKSISSEEVVEFAEKYKGGSFLLWDGSRSEGSERSKIYQSLRIKNNPKFPTLAVVHPLEKLDPSRGSLIIVPVILAQHHCQPPPTSSAMTAWLKAIRRRHGKLIATMKVALKEQDLYEERRKGYAESLQSDAQREQQEILERQKKEEEARIAQEKAEKREKLRRELLSEIPEEPESGSSEAITIGLRFSDGRSVRRRFSLSDKAKYIFDWIYGEYDIDFESLSLTTMTGNKTFMYSDVSNEESIGDVVGKSKMVALRVLVVKSEITAEEISGDDQSHENSNDSPVDA